MKCITAISWTKTRIAWALLAPLLTLSGCSSDGASQQAQEQREGFNYRAMLVNYADNIIIPAYTQAKTSAESLTQTIKSYCDAIESTADSNSFEQLGAQGSWNHTIVSWQFAELTRIGPMLDNNAALRNRIYSFATPERANSCAIDVAATSINEDDFSISNRSNNARGLGAIEYLLFNTDLNHSCDSAVTQTQQWNNLPEKDRKLARCKLAHTISLDVEEHTQLVESHWLESGENYRRLFVNIDNINEHLSQLSDALFYIDKEIKDSKLGLPLARVAECGLEACPNTVESRYARLSVDLLIFNLQAFKQVLNGGDGLGFDDIIAFEGFETISQSLNKNIDDAIAFAKTLSQEKTLFSEATTQSNTPDGKVTCEQHSASVDQNIKSYCTLHGLVKKIATQMRTDFVTIVNVDLPISSQSDND